METTIERNETMTAGEFLQTNCWSWSDMNAFDRAAMLAYIGAENENDLIDLEDWDDPEKIDEVRCFDSYWTVYRSNEEDICRRMCACKDEMELGKALAYEEGYEDAAEDFPFMTIDYIGLARDYLAKHPHKFMTYYKKGDDFQSRSSFTGYVFWDDEND